MSCGTCRGKVKLQLLIIGIGICLLSYLATKPYLFFIVTLVTGWAIIRPLEAEKKTFLKPFYGHHESKLNVKDHLFIYTELFLLGTTSFLITAPIKYNRQFILAFAILMSLSTLFLNLQKGSNQVNSRRFYFKTSLLTGVLFSLFYSFMDSGSLFDQVSDLWWKKDLCAAILMLDNVSEAIAGLMPFPFNIAIRVLINLNIAAGFIFSLFSIVLIKLALTMTNSPNPRRPQCSNE